MNVLAHRSKAMELGLLQAGYSLADIRGEYEEHVVEEQPQGLLAAVGAVSPRGALSAAGCALALGLFTAYDTGLLSPVVLSVALAAGLYLLGQAQPESTEVRHETRRPGMGHREVQERLIQWNEWQRIKEEKQEQEARKARQQANTGGR